MRPRRKLCFVIVVFVVAVTLVVRLSQRLKSSFCQVIAPTNMETCTGHYSMVAVGTLDYLRSHYCGLKARDVKCSNSILQHYLRLPFDDYFALKAHKHHNGLIYRSPLFGIVSSSKHKNELFSLSASYLVHNGRQESQDFVLGFPKPTIINYVSLATECSGSLERFVQSMDAGHRNLKIIGLGETFQGWTYRLWRVYEYTSTLKPTDVFLATDSGDILVLPHCQDSQILNGFASFETPIVFASEKACWPIPNMWWHYQRTESFTRLSGLWKFVNGGAFIAYVWAFRDLVEFLQLDACVNDQALWAQLYLTNISYLPLRIKHNGVDISYRMIAAMNPENHPSTASFVASNRNLFSPSYTNYLSHIRERHLKSEPYISLDVNNIIFQSLWLSAPDEFEAVRLSSNASFTANRQYYRTIKGKTAQPLHTEAVTEEQPVNRIVNKKSQTCPCVLHHNGNEKFSNPVLSNFAKQLKVPFAGSLDNI